MRILPAAAAFLLVGSAFAAQEPPAAPKSKPSRRAAPAPEGEERAYTVLTPGTYRCELKGLLCAACAEAIGITVSRLSGVQKAVVDFENGTLTVTIAEGAKVKMSSLERALRKAAGRVDLDTAFSILRIRYIP